jgi:hypothetical protein
MPFRSSRDIRDQVQTLHTKVQHEQRKESVAVSEAGESESGDEMTPPVCTLGRRRDKVNEYAHVGACLAALYVAHLQLGKIDALRLCLVLLGRCPSLHCMLYSAGH